MKGFIKNVAATIVGIIIVGIITLIIGTMSIVGLVASTQVKEKISDNSILMIDLDGILHEQTEDNALDILMDNNDLALSEMLKAIRHAKTNEKIKGIYIKAGNFSADMAQLEELRHALEDFKTSKKWIMAYGDIYSQPCYYIASVADKIYMNPQGTIEWKGIGGQITFYKNLLDKIGVKMIPFKCGKYKSATEIYTQDQMSQPSREQTEQYIHGWWNTMCQAVSHSRKINIDTLNAYADRVIGYEAPENMLKYKLVDGLVYDDQLRAIVNKKLNQEEDASISLVSPSTLSNVDEEQKGNNIAVYYAYGDIVDTEPSTASPFMNHQIVAKTMCQDLADIADDEDIKAVVIRVNSGGGSAFASEKIWHQIQLLKTKKPVVISMGGAAASGGYYISAPANYIFAEPTTITGSIGIFGIVQDRSNLMTQKIGLVYDTVKTNRNTLMGSPTEPMTPQQSSYMQAAIDRGYTLFKTRVANGRHMTMSQVEQNAQGHVFLGSEALKRGLVDELGGLDKAVAKAAALSKSKDFYTTEYPGNQSIIDELLSTGNNDNKKINMLLQSVLGNYYEPFMLMQTIKEQATIQARIPFRIRLN